MLGGYIGALVAYIRWRLLVALGLLALVGLTEGVGLLMLVPLLHLVGLSEEGESLSGVGAAAVTAFASVGLTLTLPIGLLGFVGLVILRALLVRWREVLLADIRLGFVDHLRIRLYRAIGRANWLFLSGRRGSDIIHVLTADINRVGEGTYFLLQLMVTGFVALVYVLVALRLSVPMTLIALLTGAGLLLILWPQVRHARRLGERLTEADRRVFGTVSEFLGGLKLAKSHGVEERHHRLFEEAVAGLRARILGFTRRNAMVRVVYQVGAAVVLSSLLYVAVAMLRLQTAELLVLVLIFSRLLPMLSNMQQSCQSLAHMLPAFAAAMRLQADCDNAAEQLPRDSAWIPGVEREIRLCHVSFAYQQEHAALSGISLVIPARRTTALVGSSGAGKSTLADLLMGLLSPASGEILVDGEPLCARRIRLWRQAVAYVPQETFLFHDTVRANLLWARPQAEEDELWRVLKLVAADRFVADLPDSLDTVVGDRGIRLSGGECQRLALARALLCRPSLLILDEATSALDTEHERRIQQAVDELHGELTILVIAHRLSTVRHADQIVVMEDGRVVEQGGWDALSNCVGGRLNALLRAGDGRNYL